MWFKFTETLILEIMEAKDLILLIGMRTKNMAEVHRKYMEIVNGKIYVTDVFTGAMVNPKELKPVTYASVCKILRDVESRNLFAKKFRNRPSYPIVPESEHNERMERFTKRLISNRSLSKIKKDVREFRNLNARKV